MNWRGAGTAPPALPVRLSLLDEDKETLLRARLPGAVRMYTGDDFNYPELIAGDGERHSDALLGIFDPIAPAASAALTERAEGRTGAFQRHPGADRAALAPHLQAPTRFYRTGVVFMASLNGHQDHSVIVGGQESARSLVHLAELFRLATPPACCAIRSWRRSACAKSWRCTGSRADARSVGRPRMAVAEPGDDARAAESRAAIEGCAQHTALVAIAPGVSRSRQGASAQPRA